MVAGIQTFLTSLSDPFSHCPKAEKWVSNRAKKEKKIAASVALVKNGGQFCPEAFILFDRLHRQKIRMLLFVRKKAYPAFPIELIFAIITYLLLCG